MKHGVHLLIAMAALAMPGCKRSKSMAVTGDELVAADATAYFAFQRGADLSMKPSGVGALEGIRRALTPLTGMDPFDPSVQEQLGVRDDRSILVSWGILDLKRFAEFQAMREPPASGTPVRFRTEIRMPLSDPEATSRALSGMKLDPGCTRSGTINEIPVEHACQSRLGAAVARIDRQRRVLHWTIVMGMYPNLTDAVAPLPRSPELVARLNNEGFFTAGIAYYATPELAGRGYALLMWIKTFAGIEGVDPSMKGELWRRSLKEVQDFIGFAESPPRLFSSHLIRDGRRSWNLTPDGQALFARREISTATSAGALNTAVARQIRPSGSFASTDDLEWALRLTRHAGPLLAMQFVWPHALAFDAAHPGTLKFPPEVQLGVPDGGRWRVEGKRLIIDPD